jgi:hypothetical protein
MKGQKDFQESWGSAQPWLTSISGTIKLEYQGQRALLECWRSAQRWLTSISATMASALLGEGGFELRAVVKPLVFFRWPSV